MKMRKEDAKHLEMFFSMVCYYRRSRDPAMIDGLRNLRQVSTHPKILDRIDEVLGTGKLSTDAAGVAVK
jgi:hypothetical protein